MMEYIKGWLRIFNDREQLALTVIVLLHLALVVPLGPSGLAMVRLLIPKPGMLIRWLVKLIELAFVNVTHRYALLV